MHGCEPKPKVLCMHGEGGPVAVAARHAAIWRLQGSSSQEGPLWCHYRTVLALPLSPPSESTTVLGLEECIPLNEDK
jgi:hypothetical protein